ncbi:bifunctional indole-3-glycerol-phosphate synthase TrpC/phosphoribosylanthranilate isomerase TrpF [Buchnera aphidicola (Formosaphis micheliae)]|uniref:bifunctional indole-3-glycerol-phosphate synthase TrpC/phosphoribosylanthranilate isomerase TrpF n=1 Tax=Buchnera aphidicola TaxID=9 RepID=UPI0031CC4B45
MHKTILQEIISNKLIWLKERKKKQPLNSFYNNVHRTRINFLKQIQNVHPFFILECKKYSPSLGLINSTFDLNKICDVYKKYASVVSVLTDEQYFHGKFEFLSIVRSIITQPILCKDFFIDVYQIYLARYYQADAILLMLSVLNDEQYNILSYTAKFLNMGVITEINNIKELERAINLKSEIIGINNRNLHDLSIDINRTKTLAPLIPNHIHIISESGINSYSQVRELSALVNGFLIGSTLMKSHNLDFEIRKIIIGQNKICGLTQTIDSKISEEAGAVYGGLIFVKNSKRYINIEQAIKIINTAYLQYVGVFQNEDINLIVSLVKELSLYAIQLHGNENQNYINVLREKIPSSTYIWKALSIKDKFPILNLKFIDYYLFDSIYGGSGTQFNWSILFNHNLSNIILAGGINLKNCIYASKLGCAGLDFNSGVEDSQGKKNKKKIISVFHSLRYYYT